MVYPVITRVVHWVESFGFCSDAEPGCCDVVAVKADVLQASVRVRDLVAISVGLLLVWCFNASHQPFVGPVGTDCLPSVPEPGLNGQGVELVAVTTLLT